MDIAHFIHLLPARRKKRTAEQKLKILKRELKYTIRKLTDWKDFVFADSHKKEAQVFTNGFILL